MPKRLPTTLSEITKDYVLSKYNIEENTKQVKRTELTLLNLEYNIGKDSKEFLLAIEENIAGSIRALLAKRRLKEEDVNVMVDEKYISYDDEHKLCLRFTWNVPETHDEVVTRLLKKEVENFRKREGEHSRQEKEKKLYEKLKQKYEK